MNGIIVLFCFLNAVAHCEGDVAQSFTAKRKKGPSANSLKEQCCTSFGEVLSQSAGILSSIGLVQSNAVEIVSGYAQGDKQSWCEKASREQLKLCHEKLTLVGKKIEELDAACKEVAACIKLNSQ